MINLNHSTRICKVASLRGHFIQKVHINLRKHQSHAFVGISQWNRMIVSFYRNMTRFISSRRHIWVIWGGGHSQKAFPYVRLFTMKWVVGTVLWTGYQGWVKQKREESRRSSWVSLSRPPVWRGANKGPCAIISSAQHYRLHLSKWKMCLLFPWRTFFQIFCHSNCENN